MTLPYENATSGARAIKDMQRILQTFGCANFDTMMDHQSGELMVQFEYRSREVSIKASIEGYAAAWLEDHPHTDKTTSKFEHGRKAKHVASIAIYSILRDWIKGQITAIETGLLTF